MLKKLREKMGYTQQDLSNITGISIKTISNIENGKDCNTKIVKKLAILFDTTLEDILEIEKKE